MYAQVASAISVANAFKTVSTVMPAPTLMPQRAGPLTINFVNSHGADVSTAHVNGSGSPAAISGNVGPGIIRNGATVGFAVPTAGMGMSPLCRPMEHFVMLSRCLKILCFAYALFPAKSSLSHLYRVFLLLTSTHNYSEV